MALYAYVPAALDNSLTILDVTDPTAPAFKSNIAGSGAPNFLGVVIDIYPLGDYCYCTCVGTAVLGGDACLTIVDISNPAAPAFKSSLPFGTNIYSRFLFVVGSYAYVTDQYSGLYIIDISNPLLPSIVGSISLAAMGLTVAGSITKPYIYGAYAYMTYVDALNAGVVVIDISNPAAPTLKGRLDEVPSVHFAYNFPFLSGNYLYAPAGLPTSLNALNVVDISNPAAPIWKSWITGAGAPNFLSGCYLVYKEGNYCYCGTLNGLTIIDVSNPLVPAFVSNLSLLNTNVLTIFKSGNNCYCASPLDNKMYIVDVSNVALPVLKGSLSGAGNPNYLAYPTFITLSGGYPGPTPSPYQSPPCIIDFKGILDCIGWKWRAGGI